MNAKEARSKELIKQFTIKWGPFGTTRFETLTKEHHEQFQFELMVMLKEVAKKQRKNCADNYSKKVLGSSVQGRRGIITTDLITNKLLQ